ncbi:prosaposin-like [Oryzias latipes]|uniref:Surfactant protein Bb n=2 Tax=Oryzias latipes TaxID=8090 RepID=A0A3B3HCJ8_ORYLA|nr:prosaposin-like [Oryzias latipes]
MSAWAGFGLLLLAAALRLGESRFIMDPVSFITQELQSLDLCGECSQIIRTSTNMISGSDTKVTVYEALHAVCRRLPERQASDCQSQVKTYLPKVLQQKPSHLNPSETCVVFGLCAPQKDEELQEPPPSVNSEALSNSAPASATETQKISGPVCALCLMVIRKLETMLPKNISEDAILKIMEEVCDLVPASYKQQCDDFVNKYGADIAEFLFSSAAPHTICMVLHLCLFKEQPVPEVLLPSDCESCRTLAALHRVHLGLNATGAQTSAFLQSVCSIHPNAIPKCDAFTRAYGSQLHRVLGNQMDISHTCERADLCQTMKKLDLLGSNPCTWGPSYWCQNRETAQKCGNQIFCEKFKWKS